MNFHYHDGGRSAAGYKGTAGDCVVRAIAIATGIPYIEVYTELFKMNRAWVQRNADRVHKTVMASGGSPRTGIFKQVYHKFLTERAWLWQPTMFIGQGCRVHMRAHELPAGTIIVSLSRHMACVIDGTLFDTHDCTRNGSRCVYGYYYKK